MYRMYIEMFFYQTACLLHCITWVDKNACNKYHVDFMHWCSNSSEFSLPLSLRFWFFSHPWRCFLSLILFFSPAALPTLSFSYRSLPSLFFWVTSWARVHLSPDSRLAESTITKPFMLNCVEWNVNMNSPPAINSTTTTRTSLCLKKHDQKFNIPVNRQLFTNQTKAGIALHYTFFYPLPFLLVLFLCLYWKKNS